MASRRTLLRFTASIAPIYFLYGVGGAAVAQQKSPKDAVNYQDQPNNGDKCSQCRFFSEPGSCDLVEGEISPEGWCNLFQAAE